MARAIVLGKLVSFGTVCDSNFWARNVWNKSQGGPRSNCLHILPTSLTSAFRLILQAPSRTGYLCLTLFIETRYFWWRNPHMSSSEPIPEPHPELAFDIRNKFLGPMPVDIFLQEFVPVASAARPQGIFPFSGSSVSQNEDEFVSLLSPSSSFSVSTP